MKLISPLLVGRHGGLYWESVNYWALLWTVVLG